MVGQLSDNINKFFEYAAERERIRLRRAAAQPRPWTDDPALAQYRFCNVDREHDATTIWFREHVRDRLRDVPEVMLATVLFRWFNRISTGEAIFEQGVLDLGSGVRIKTPWEYLLLGGTDAVGVSIRSYCGEGPYVTGSYIIKTPDGMNKLDGVLWCVEQFMLQDHMTKMGMKLNWGVYSQAMLDREGCTPLEDVWDWLRQFPFLGDFMSYEIVTDLRHTALLDHAPDIMTWANPGPGARRGLNCIHGRTYDASVPRVQLIKEMRGILEIAIKENYVPGVSWEMRTVEHTACEWAKLCRVRSGGSPPRGRLKS